MRTQERQRWFQKCDAHGHVRCSCGIEVRRENWSCLCSLASDLKHIWTPSFPTCCQYNIHMWLGFSFLYSFTILDFTSTSNYKLWRFFKSLGLTFSILYFLRSQSPQGYIPLCTKIGDIPAILQPKTSEHQLDPQYENTFFNMECTIPWWIFLPYLSDSSWGPRWKYIGFPLLVLGRGGYLNKADTTKSQGVYFWLLIT